MTKTVLSYRKYKLVFLSSTISFSIIYMFFTGIFIITARPIPEGFTIPWFNIGRIETAIGYLPWFVAYLDRHLIFSMSSDAMFYTIIISILVGINSAFLSYHFGIRPSVKSCKAYKGPVGLFGLVPAFLSLFACCGGGILVMIFGAAIIAALFPYAYVFGLTSIAVLSIGILFSARDLEKKLMTKKSPLTNILND